MGIPVQLPYCTLRISTNNVMRIVIPSGAPPTTTDKGLILVMLSLFYFDVGAINPVFCLQLLWPGRHYMFFLGVIAGKKVLFPDSTDYAGHAWSQEISFLSTIEFLTQNQDAVESELT